MREEPVLTAVSGLVLDYFRAELVPAVLGSADMVKLTAPNAQEDFRLGLYLYDLEAVRSGGSGTMSRVSGSERRHPDLRLALRFFAFANRKAAFHSMEAGDELLLLEAAVRAVHSAPGFPAWEGGALRLDSVDGEGKKSLWQSLDAPLQPAVYFIAEPVSIPSARVRRVPEVRSVDTAVQNRKGEGP